MPRSCIETVIQICLLLTGARKACLVDETKRLYDTIEKFFAGVLYAYDGGLITNHQLPKRWKWSMSSIAKLLQYTGPNSSIISFTYQNKDYALTSMRSPTNICASQIKKAKEWYKS